MSQKIEFVERASKDGANMSRLCREYGISRQTGHKWLARFKARGHAGLEEESRRPHATPGATGEELVLAVIEVRETHPTWGPKKLEVVLKRKFAEQTPSRATIARILERFGRVRKRHQVRAKNVIEHAPKLEAASSNDVWSVDFKGWWRNGDGNRCEPLTVRDAFSRYVLTARAMPGTKLEPVKAEFERLFRKYGIPKTIQCDNGVPFISTHSRGGLTRLSAWWVSLGIEIARSRPGCPQDNGAHERMHRDISEEVEAFPELSRQAAQRALDRWKQTFNHVRPHEALGGKVPADLYKSGVGQDLKLRRFAYPPQWRCVNARSQGRVSVDGISYLIGEAFAGYVLGLEPISGLTHRLWFGTCDIGTIELAPSLDMIERQVESRSKTKSPKKSRITISKLRK